MVVVVVVAAVVAVPVAGALVRRHTRLVFVAVQVKRTPPLVRCWPGVLHVVPAMAGGGADDCAVWVSGTATGSAPVMSAAPSEMVWQMMHIVNSQSTERRAAPRGIAHHACDRTTAAYPEGH